jgi:hypothetical protein
MIISTSATRTKQEPATPNEPGRLIYDPWLPRGVGISGGIVGRYHFVTPRIGMLPGEVGKLPRERYGGIRAQEICHQNCRAHRDPAPMSGTRP